MAGFIECAIPSCSVKLEGDDATIEKAKELGWKNLTKSSQPPEKKVGRTHLGWCPKCAAYYSVEDPKPKEEKEDKPKDEKKPKIVKK